MQTALRYGRVLRTLLLVLLWLCTTAAAQTESDTASIKPSTTNASSSSSSSRIASSIQDARNSEARQATCRPGTVNYITHSLPQQCLTRSSPTSNSTSTVTLTTTPSSSNTSSAHEDLTSTATTTTTTTTETLLSSTTQPEAEFETDSPLDNANFLSFEEWKKQNLAKVGQSPDHVGQKSRSAQDQPPRIMRPVDNALDVLGEDSEIELDFGGFGRQDNPSSSTVSAQPTVASDPTLRSKDAGKTCKERSNYASFDCAATILKSNPESKSASAVLIENKDSYMLNICSSSNKFLIVELCNDILIDTVVLANYEFFSSIFRNFRVSVSDRYPVKPDRWKELGVFEARNTRSVQAFLVEQPLIWARYIRIEFLTHYGNEYYCPVSLLRVHGTTMMEEFRHQEELARGEISDDLEESVMPDASQSLAQEPLQSSKEADESVVVESATPKETSSQRTEPLLAASSSSSSSTDISETLASTKSAKISTEDTSTSSSLSNYHPTSNGTTVSHDHTQSQKVTPTNSSSVPQTTADSSLQADSFRDPTPTSIELSASSQTNSANATRSSEITPSAQGSSTATTSTHHTSSNPATDSSSRPVSLNSTSQALPSPSSSVKSTNSSSKPLPASPDAQQKHGTPTASSAHSNPTTQESFFKSIHKRLQMLESNATLSLQYIEEQSRMLRDAFIKVEKRQIKKTEAFLENLNTTVFAELQDFKQQYDQLWQSTVIELENHRDQYQREIVAVSARLSIVADELVFQKRMAIVQMTVLMICLSLVLFVRAGGGAGLDIPIIQQMVNKSHLRRGSYYSPLNSPSPDQTSPPFPHSDARHRRGFWRSSVDTPMSARPTSRGNGNISEASIEEHPEHENPELRFEPPSPTHETIDREDGIMVSPTSSPMPDRGTLMDDGLDSEVDGSSASLPQETQSSPSTPSGSRDLKTLQSWPTSEELELSGAATDSPRIPDMKVAG